ncbi:signal peptidase I [Thaumasiovibrio subtropicus]|uniref:signal peptidase I n=1 Tax=Thaumasiovibrio subtropicus TaxID=1891207 RepID=UPI000B353CC7|nr:signal peptidase I [Thaumasiovibrio subtropicus]
MANMFSLLLVILTLGTGIVWALDKYVWAPRRQLKVQAAVEAAGGDVDAETAASIAPQPAWVENAASTFPVIAFVLVLRSFIYEPFQIPSGSMMPTLLVGDFILVEKFSYGLRDPVFRHKFIETGEPERGDVAVFKYPPQPNIDYIKRVIGLPGDTVQYNSRTKQLCVQPKGESRCAEIVQSDVQESEFFEGFTTLIQIDEQLTDDLSHQVLVNPKKRDREMAYQPTPGRGVWVVPEGHYFVMGDNRDNSADSRYWGFVPEANLVGKAVAIWISFEFDRDPESIISWVPTGVRFSRIGGIE